MKVEGLAGRDFGTVYLFGKLGRRQAAHLPYPLSRLFYLRITFRQPWLLAAFVLSLLSTSEPLLAILHTYPAQFQSSVLSLPDLALRKASHSATPHFQDRYILSRIQVLLSSSITAVIRPTSIAMLYLVYGHVQKEASCCSSQSSNGMPRYETL